MLTFSSNKSNLTNLDSHIKQSFGGGATISIEKGNGGLQLRSKEIVSGG